MVRAVKNRRVPELRRAGENPVPAEDILIEIVKETSSIMGERFVQKVHDHHLVVVFTCLAKVLGKAAKAVSQSRKASVVMETVVFVLREPEAFVAAHRAVFVEAEVAVVIEAVVAVAASALITVVLFARQNLLK